MSSLGPVHSIVVGAIERIAPRVTYSYGLDKQRWLAMLMRYMRLCEPHAHRAIVSAAGEEQYRSLIESYIRSSKSAAIENLTDLDRVKRSLKAGRRIVQIRDAAGVYYAKRLIDCTPVELDVLAAQYERSSASDARRARFCRMLAQQMRLAGFGEQDQLRRWAV
jgi:hypothetical protein